MQRILFNELVYAELVYAEYTELVYLLRVKPLSEYKILYNIAWTSVAKQPSHLLGETSEMVDTYICISNTSVFKNSTSGTRIAMYADMTQLFTQQDT